MLTSKIMLYDLHTSIDGSHTHTVKVKYVCVASVYKRGYSYLHLDELVKSNASCGLVASRTRG